MVLIPMATFKSIFEHFLSYSLLAGGAQNTWAKFIDRKAIPIH